MQHIPHIVAGGLLALTAFWSGPALALDKCESMWFWRNQIFHEAGACFRSTLGQATFGNEGCRKGAAPTGEMARLATIIAGRERDYGCKVDTGLPTLPNVDTTLLGKVRRPPIDEGEESSCYGYRGDELALRAAPSETAEIIATIPDSRHLRGVQWAPGTSVPGPSLAFDHVSVGGWYFLSADEGDRTIAVGWTDSDMSWDEVCAVQAG